jgi:hypothetical protein
MSRFYKATAGKFIDNKMFELDANAMMKATETVDQNITDVYDQQEKGLASLKSESLDIDDPAVRERLLFHQGKIDAVDQAMNEDILGYKKHGVTMRGISRGISSDLNTGVFSATEGNLADHKEIMAEIDKDKNLTNEQKSLEKECLPHQI